MRAWRQHNSGESSEDNSLENKEDKEGKASKIRTGKFRDGHTERDLGKREKNPDATQSTLSN